MSELCKSKEIVIGVVYESMIDGVVLSFLGRLFPPTRETHGSNCWSRGRAEVPVEA